MGMANGVNCGCCLKAVVESMFISDEVVAANAAPVRERGMESAPPLTGTDETGDRDVVFKEENWAWGEGMYSQSGSPGVNAPSSRSLSKVMIEPSANETRNKDADPGTQRTCVHGDLHIEPFKA